MPKITPLQDTLYEITPGISRKRVKLFTGKSELTAEMVKTFLLEGVKDAEIQQELQAILLDPTNFSKLKTMISDVAPEIQHLFRGHSKLHGIRNKEKQINEI
ncbi:MAG: hypothetical protein LBU27_05135 [Candidatus Peribacteria bacterium]|jgi:methyl coenzyme M reductase alpha subunit|nr:hypothetical protein [Candidatus Peribacteria bacterium]